ncbi:ABC transporter permease [Thermoanaerobacterium sp. DL9XJH110]|uniref:ABC transporter permease n=1 Tax=Thermoanaerobacterium sp. DL9XJH110 TaxID=3386643 RepID=UPI003BB6D434
MERNIEFKAETQKKFKVDLQRYGMTLVFILMVVIMSVLSPNFLEPRNLMNVVRQISIIATVGFGVTMIIITTGIDLSSGSVIALVSVISASFAHPDEYPLIVPILIGILVGGVTGFINGTLVAKGKLPPFIATLGMMIAARGLALIYSDGRPITNFSSAFDFIGRGYLFGVPFPIYVLIIVAVISHVLLKHTKFGKYIYAIGGNEQAAVVSGIDVDKYKIMVYTYAGFMTAIAGILLTSRLSAGQPTAGVGYELDAIAASVIGGTSLNGGIGTIPGTVVGALIMGVLNNGLDLLHVSAYWQQVVKGLIIVGAVLMDKQRRV